MCFFPCLPCWSWRPHAFSLFEIVYHDFPRLWAPGNEYARPFAHFCKAYFCLPLPPNWDCCCFFTAPVRLWR